MRSLVQRSLVRCEFGVPEPRKHDVDLRKHERRLRRLVSASCRGNGARLINTTRLFELFATRAPHGVEDREILLLQAQAEHALLALINRMAPLERASIARLAEAEPE